MSTTRTDLYGPIDFVLLEFPRDRLTGAASKALRELVASGTIRLLDLTVITKNDDDSVEALELTDAASDQAGFASFAQARSGLLGEEDVREAARAMTSGTVAALIVYENTWAGPFVAAARDSGGEVVASGRIPATDVIDALDRLEAAEPTR